MGREAGAWPCHGIEHELSAWYDITHGVGLAIITPHWMAYSLKANPAVVAPRLAQYGVNVLGLNPADGVEVNAKKAIEKTYGRKSQKLVEKNFAAVDQALANRQHQKLPQRAGSAHHAHGPATIRRRHMAANFTVHHAIRGAGQRQANQQPGGTQHGAWRGGQRHQRQTQHITQRTPQQRPPPAPAVGQHAGNRLKCTPQQVLHGNCQGKHFPGPSPDLGIRARETGQRYVARPSPG